MARGIKKSGGSINTIYYHTWPASGNSSIEGADWYIPGVGTDELAQATHDGVKPPELSDLVDVYLEGELVTLPSWHEEEDLSDTAITSISSSDTEDKDLYAKWVYNMYLDDVNYELLDRPQNFITLSSGDVLFKWGDD